MAALINYPATFISDFGQYLALEAASRSIIVTLGDSNLKGVFILLMGTCNLLISYPTKLEEGINTSTHTSSLVK